jgi:hypothetical protein
MAQSAAAADYAGQFSCTQFLDASAGVLPRRDRTSTAFASLIGSAGAGAVRHQKSSFLQAEADWTEGCHRKPETTGAEIS